MKELKAFDIDIISLKNQRYDFDFKGDDSFFAAFENSLVSKGSFSVHLQLAKSETMMQLDFSIMGSVEVACDRSLELFDYPLQAVQKHILKFGETGQDLTDEIEIISRDVTTVNVAQYVYEFIILAMPMKKIHPKYAGQAYPENAEGLLIYTSKVDLDPADGAESQEGDMDPRWAALRKLSDN